MKLWEAFRQKLAAPSGKNAPKPKLSSGEVLLAAASSTLSGNEQTRRLAFLTPRERELFLLLLEGFTLKESAKQLSVQYSTANTHMTSIYKKLQVKSRAELIIRYRSNMPQNV